MKIAILILMAIAILTSIGYCQNTQELIGQINKIYSADKSAGNSLIAGFSMAGFLGGILFGSIGFVAFMYGKRNSEFRPMILGILLISYPYFLKNTIALYIVGIALTVVLFVWRE
ncbi:MAG: hypothetical protein KKF78_09715 [Candidatus Omnitrophica bacterium]|nr:hypothetical protein [Candidatus Omnitrophota bacterium]MBU1997416.1 hypothetical protein [Candidatus Omnitrophota bacterium]